MEGVLRFGRKGRLSSKFIGPFEILEWIDPVAYKFALPPSLSGEHDVVHVLILRKYKTDPINIINYETLQLKEDLIYGEKPIRILT